MFKDLFVFEKERSKKEAFGFYLAYLLLGALLGGFMGFFLVPSSDNPSGSSTEEFWAGFQAGSQIGLYWGVAFCLAISFVVLFKKKKLQDFGLVLIALLSGVGAMFFGGLLGLIPAAYLTTIKEEQEEG